MKGCHIYHGASRKATVTPNTTPMAPLFVPLFDYTPGGANEMSKDFSQRWDLADLQLCVHFDLVFPQSQPW
jgi:hypothetical protein